MQAITRKDARATRLGRRVEHESSAATEFERGPRAFWIEHGPIVLVMLAALALRLYGLSRRYVVLDESVILDPDILRFGLLQYAAKVWHETTYNPGWLILIWVVNRVFGLSTFWARLPSAVCSALTPVALYAAARGLGLGRWTATLAGLVMALAIHQIEYGQQIMPHAALPLGCCLCVALVSKLGEWRGTAAPWRMLALMSGLIAVFGVLVLLHSSALLLIPMLLAHWAWSALRPVAGERAEVAAGRRFAWSAWVVCTLALGFASFGWFFAKAGASDWGHLRPFFLATFRQAPDRAIVSDTLEVLDAWYVKAVPRPRATLDAAYFAATRVFDFLHGQFKLKPEQQFTLSRPQWLLPLILVFLVARGAFWSVREGGKTVASRWVICAGGTLALVLGFSALRLFPLGGIRHLIVLSPFAFLTAALGLRSASRTLSLGLAAACLLWVLGAAVWLPSYYKSTNDRLPPRFAALAAKYGVEDFVAADTICSEGALRLMAASCPGGRMVPADDPRFGQLTLEHRPFFLCSLGDLIFEPSRTKDTDTDTERNPVPTRLLKQLAHPLANLRYYRAVPIVSPHRWTSWLTWRVYYMEPLPGPYAPEVAALADCKPQDRKVPLSFLVRFSKPICPETITTETVQLVARSETTGYGNQPLIPLDLHYTAATRTLLVTPLRPLDDTAHLLALYRKIRDTEGRPLDANGPAFYHQFTSRPPTGSLRQDRGWLLQTQSGMLSSKL